MRDVAVPDGAQLKRWPRASQRRAAHDPNDGSVAEMKILVCLDESELSRSVLPIARRLANLNTAQVDLVQVIEFRGQSQAKEEDEIRKSLERCLEGFPSHARSVVLHERNAAEAIIAYARLQGAEIIAMVGRARPSVAEALLGSTTHAVLRSGVAPVLVVHPSGVAAAPASGAARGAS